MTAKARGSRNHNNEQSGVLVPRRACQLPGRHRAAYRGPDLSRPSTSLS